MYYPLCQTGIEYYLTGLITGFAVGILTKILCAALCRNDDPLEITMEENDHEEASTETATADAAEDVATSTTAEAATAEAEGSNDEDEESKSNGRELFEMLDNELKQVTETENATKTTDPPIRFHVSSGGGYVTNAQLGTESYKYAVHQKVTNLPHSKECEILRNLSYILNKPFLEAKACLGVDAYILHPIYVVNANKGTYTSKMCRYKFEDNVIGVIIEDPWFNFDTYKATGICNPSNSSHIAKILDVGGLDNRDEGMTYILANYTD